MEEIWKEIPGHPGYEASSHGRIKSMSRVLIDKNGKKRPWKERILKPQRGSGPLYYLGVRLGAVPPKTIHVLVLLTFVGPRPRGFVGCHNDGNPTNCKLSNLRWDSRSGNESDKAAHGTRRLGQMNQNAKLTDAQAASIKRDPRSGPVIAAEYGISRGLPNKIKRGDVWRHV